MQNLKVLDLEVWKSEFSEDICNYDKVQEYLDFIKEAVERYDSSRYSEWHHVIPRCADNDKKYRDQCVEINGADHFKAHMKLVNCFNGKLKSRMTYALMRMKYNVISKGEIITPEDWELAVKLYSQQNSIRMSQRVGPLNSMYGKHREISERQRRLLSERMKGERNPRYKVKWSDAHNEYMSKKFSGESNPFYGKTHTEETKRQISESRLGEKNPCYNKIWITNGVDNKRILSEELEIYQSLGYKKGRTFSTTQKERHREAMMKRKRDSKGRYC